MLGLLRVLHMPQYAWLCLNMLEHARAFVLRLPIVIPCLLERVVAYFNVYKKNRRIGAIFWRERVWLFSVVAGSIWFVFYFRLGLFTSETSNLLFPLETEGTRDRETWILIFLIVVAMIFLWVILRYTAPGRWSCLKSCL